MWARRETCGGSIAAPGPVFDVLDETCPHRIQDDVATRLEKVAVPLNELGFEAPGQDVPNPRVPPVPPLRVDTIELVNGR